MPRARALNSIERDRYQLEKALSDLKNGRWTELAGMEAADLQAAIEQRLNEVIEEMGRSPSACG